MKHHKLGAAALAAAYALILNSTTAAVVTFESVSLPPAGYWNGSDGGPDITSEGVLFNNTYTALYDSWSGFSVSNHTDTITPGYLNQYSAITGVGAGGSAKYAVGYFTTYETSTNITFAALTNLAGKGAQFTNTTYAALDMRDGGSFGSKKFGGTNGNDADWFKLTITGYAAGSATGTSIDFYLADFRFSDNSLDYILDEWAFADFTTLGTVDELRITMSSTDNGMFGMNTPAYFAMDNFLIAVPEPSSLLISIASLGLFLRRKR
jgi:hypothetical protein